MSQEYRPRSKRNSLLKAVLIILILLLCWYFFAPLMGLAVGLTAGAFGFLVAVLVLLGVACLFAPILAGLWMMIFGLAIIVLGILGIVLFPIILPFLIPIIIILIIIRLIFGR